MISISQHLTNKYPLFVMKGYNEEDKLRGDMIVSGREAISAVEVENLLLLHEAVAEAAVVAVPHELWGEVPFAFVVSKNKESKMEAEMEAEIIVHCRRGMTGAFMVPERIVFVSELPKTPMGKVRKTMLMELARRLKKSGSASPAAAPAAAAAVMFPRSVRRAQVGEEVLQLAKARL